MKKTLPLLLLFSILLFPPSILAQTPGLQGKSFCEPPVSGQTWTITTDCVLYEDYNGPINANMTLQTGSTLTLHSGKNLIWYPGKAITIESGASIIVNTGSQITQRPLCVNTVDIGGSKYALALTATRPSEFGGGTVYLGLDQQVPVSATSACSTLGAGYVDATSLASRDYISMSATPGTDTGFLATSYRNLLNLGMSISSINNGVREVFATGNLISILGDNLKICITSPCTLATPADYGNLIVERNVGIGTGSPASSLSVGSSSQFQVNSTGAIAAATGITSSGTITFSGLTASRLVTTTTGGQLNNSITSANLDSTVSDDTGSGVLVFGTTPTFTTSIIDPLVIGGTGTTSTLSLRSTSGVGATGADIIFQTGNNGATEAMRILNSGNVGIGITSPGAPLEVQIANTALTGIELSDAGASGGSVIFGDGTSTTSQFLPLINTAAVGATADWGLEIQGKTPYDNAASAGIVLTAKNTTGAALANAPVLRVASADNAAALLVVKNSGNVGIGMTSPTRKLEVEHGSGTTGNTLYVNRNLASASTNAPVAFIQQQNVGDDQPALYIEQAGTGAGLIVNSGNVGIGTTGPLSTLSVGGVGIGNTAIYGIGATYGVYGKNSSSGYAVYGQNSGTGYAVYGQNSGTGYGIYCEAVTANNCGGNQAWNGASDRRLKENIVPINNALAKVLKLQGVIYNLKSDPAKTPQMGFIAQDALPYIPEVVSLNKTNNYYGMQTSQITALLVNAMKEQQNQITGLQKEIEELKAIIKSSSD